MEAGAAESSPRRSVSEGKPRPDFAGTDEYQVALTLRGEIQDEAFLRFLERIGQETLASFSTTDLDKAHAKALLMQHLEKFGTANIQEFEQALPQHTRDAIHRLLGELKSEEKVEVLGKKRGSRWALKN